MRLTDAEIDTSEIPPLDEAFFQRAEWWTASCLVSVTLQIDAETLDWFKAQQDSAQTINAALRLYVQAHRHYQEAR